VNSSSRPTNVSFQSSSPPGMVSPEVLSPAERQQENPIWVDLTPLNRAALSTIQEQYGLPSEAMTYFLLHYQSAKLIHAGPVLFLVTFLAVPSSRYLFTMRELKICVSSTVIVTMCGPAGKALPDLAQNLPAPSLNGGQIGQLLHDLLEETVRSYEAIVKAVEERGRCDVPREEKQRRRKQVEKLVRFLREEQSFLGNVTREGRKLLAAEESRQIRGIAERVGVLARTAWETTLERKALVANPAIPAATQAGDDA
jgi:Mg2+ and Co2+ transporter CorA